MRRKKYALLITDSWGAKYIAEHFTSIDGALSYAEEHFPPELVLSWELIDVNTEIVVFSRSFTNSLESLATQEANRFAQTQHWREFYAENKRRMLAEKRKQQYMHLDWTKVGF